MRIISGKYKGTKLPTFKSKEIRPTTDRAKEAIFSFIENESEIQEATVLDLFAGSGTISVEFLSRGAKHVTSLDKGKESIQYLKDIKKKIESPKEWYIQSTDVIKYIRDFKLDSFTIIFADPPYGMKSIQKFCADIISTMPVGCIFILEHNGLVQFHSPHKIESKIFGKSAFSIFRKSE